jgi:tRNA(adenine34) deaminase
MTDEHFMRQALKEARLAEEKGEVPIGAVVVMNGQVIGRGHNQVEMLTDCTAHAEMIALTSAFNYLGAKYLMDATLYVTLEPCVMCAGALYWSKIGRIVYAAPDEKNGYRRVTDGKSPFHPKTKVETGLLGEESLQMVKEFFQKRRK